MKRGGRRSGLSVALLAVLASIAGCGLGPNMQGAAVAPGESTTAVGPWDAHLPSYEKQVESALKRWRDANTAHFFQATTVGGVKIATVSGDYRMSTSEAFTEVNPHPGHGLTVNVAVTTRDSTYFGTMLGGRYSTCWVETTKLPASFAGFPDAVTALAEAHGVHTHGDDVTALTSLYTATNAMAPWIASALPEDVRSADVPITVDIDDGEVAGWRLDVADIRAVLDANDTGLPSWVSTTMNQGLKQGAGLEVDFSDVGNAVSIDLPADRPIVQRSDPDLAALCLAGTAHA